MSTRALGQQAAAWLNDLAILTAGTTPLADSKAKIATLAKALAGQYPAGVFCERSLLEVGRHCKFFPSYAELCNQLDTWWKDNRPRRPELPAPVDAWAERARREHDDALESWGTITPVEVRAKIADVEAQPASTWKVACGRLLAGALRKHAPHHLGLLPPPWLSESDSPAPTSAAPSVKPHYLTPEQAQAEKERIRPKVHA